jgi:hypothetical protein
MAHKRPLFYGDSEIGQIFKIFKTLGTPTNDTWDGITGLPEFKVSFPQWRTSAFENLKKMSPNLDDKGLDLL